MFISLLHISQHRHVADSPVGTSCSVCLRVFSCRRFKCPNVTFSPVLTTLTPYSLKSVRDFIGTPCLRISDWQSQYLPLSPFVRLTVTFSTKLLLSSFFLTDGICCNYLYSCILLYLKCWILYTPIFYCKTICNFVFKRRYINKAIIVYVNKSAAD